MTEIHHIGLVACDKENGDYEVVTTIDDSEMDADDFEDASQATEDLLTALRKKDFAANSRSKRVHKFAIDDYEDENEDIGLKETLNNLLAGDSFEAELENLAERYLLTDYSHSGLLIASRFSYQDTDLLGVMKSPYDVAYEPDSDYGLSQLEEVIGDDLKKGAIYPYMDVSSSSSNDNKMGIYQKSWSQHWWKFFKLADSKTPDEILGEQVVSETQTVEPLEDVNDASAIPQAADDLEEDELEGEVRINISDIVLDVKLRDLIEQKVRIIKDDGYHVVISGNEPDFSIKNPGAGDYRRDVLDDLEEYESFDDL